MEDSIKKRLDIGIEELILAILVVLCTAEFLKVLPADMDYIKKIMSWAGLGYLLYKVNITEIIFGYKDKLIDTGLIIAYFLLVMKNFILFSRIAIEQVAQGSFLTPLYAFVLDNAFTFELITFYAGAGLILLLALLNIFLNTEIREPSIMAIIHKEGPAETITQRISRGLTSFIIYSAFFVIVFNLVMEWLAWAVDSIILVLIVFFYFLFFIKHYKRLKTESFLFKAGDAGDVFYGKFISLFRSRKTILAGISGLLVLHLLTDVGTFIVPYILGQRIDYFVTLGAGHATLINLLLIDLGIAATIPLKISVIITYIFNIAAMLFLFVGPALIWYEMRTEKRIYRPNIMYGFFFASVFVFLVSPVFRLQRISIEGLYGVDILTNTIEVSSAFLVMSTALALFAVLSILSFSSVIRNIMNYLFVFGIEAFFAYYIYLFFIDIMGFYAHAIVLVKDYFILFYLFIFLAITLFFYVGGILNFIYTTILDITKKFI